MRQLFHPKSHWSLFPSLSLSASFKCGLTGRSFPLSLLASFKCGLTTCLMKEQVCVVAATVHNTSDWLSWLQRMDLPTYHTDKNLTLNALVWGSLMLPKKVIREKFVWMSASQQHLCYICGADVYLSEQHFMPCCTLTSWIPHLTDGIHHAAHAHIQPLPQVACARLN